MDTESQKSEQPQKKKKHIFRKICKYFALFLLFLIMGACAGLYWLCQTRSGQDWLMASANKFLSPEPGKPGLRFLITSLSGSLPFNFQFGIEAHDQDGLWLSAPANSFVLDWREMPGKIHIRKLKISDADLSRLPKIPKNETAVEESKPFTIKDLQDLLQAAGNFLYEKHWWLPELIVEGTGIENFLLPASLLADFDKDNPRPVINSDLTVKFIANAANIHGLLDVGAQNGSQIKLPSLALKKARLELAAEISPEATAQKLLASSDLSLKLDNAELELPDFPKDLLGKESALNIALKAEAITNPQNPALSIDLQGPILQAGSLSAEGSASWHSGEGWKQGKLDGPQKTRLNLAYNPPAAKWLAENPKSPLAMLPNSIRLALLSSGALPESDLLVDLSTSGIEVSDKEISDFHILLKGADLAIPLDENTMQALLQERLLNLDLQAKAENIPIRLQTDIFFQAKAEENARDESLKIGGWLAGLRKLALQAGGIHGNGDIACLIAEGQMPALNGKLAFNMDNWQTINKFLPDMSLSGKLAMQLELDDKPGQSANNGSSVGKLRLPDKTQANQNVSAEINVPTLKLTMGKDKYSISNFKTSLHASNIFGKPDFDANINAAQIQAAGMALALKAGASGQLDGPINVSLQSSGNINSSIEAGWKPGEANVRKLDLAMNLPAGMSPSGKSARLALRSRQPISLAYGEKGFAAQGLDLEITPSGRLKGHASLGPDKLDCKLQLENLNFKPWQAIVSQIPSGSANLSASLTGSPKRPAGNFQLNVNKLVVPGVSLPPVSLNLKGGIENHSAASSLQLALALDQSTLKTLGGTVGQVSATLPLNFGNDGIPRPDMNGNINAKVRWDGALGPLWNLVPVADMRLNGRVKVNIDADGKLKAPRVRGDINVKGARFEEVALGVLLTDINLKLDLKDQLSGLKSAPKEGGFQLPGGALLAFSASDGRGGKINVSGHAGLTGNNLDINAKIDHLKPLRRRDIHIELSGNASVKGEATAPVIAGEIIVNQGEVLLNNLEMVSSNITTLPITEPGQARQKTQAAPSTASAPPKGKGSLDVRIRMLPRFTVEGRGLTSIWQANLLVKGTPEDPRITGEISSVKGNFDFLGKNFALTKGVVFFGGGLVSNPLLDIDLTNETPDLTAHLLVTGPVSKIRLRMTSDPSLPRDEILSRVLFGRSVGDLSRMEALQLAAAVAQLAGFGGGTGILGMAKKALGVDVLRLGTSASNAAGEPGDQTAGGTTIEMGKYINDILYMGVQQGMQPDSTAFIIQLELTPRTNLEIRTEQNNTWGGLQWKYNY